MSCGRDENKNNKKKNKTKQTNKQTNKKTCIPKESCRNKIIKCKDPDVYKFI